MKVAIAGASGFIGSLLIDELSKNYEIIALGRTPQDSSGSTVLEWRSCDLFSLLQTENALKGADAAIYLVHSMLPRASLTQSSFEDLDLLLADNFSRAAHTAGVKRIIYLGGLIPDVANLSKHLESRREVETALSSYEIPVTTLRSGLVLGAQGSSFQMLYLLVKRLPIMLCPKWARTRTQCIASEDVIALILYALRHDATSGKTYDIGSPEVLNYRALMELLADAMGVKRSFIPTPFFSPGLSKFWVQVITGASGNLVGPLIESLQHEMIVTNPALLEMYGKSLMSIRNSLASCVQSIKPTLRHSTKERAHSLKGRSDVRSVQRLPLPKGRTSAWLAKEYFRWLPNFLAPLIKVEPLGEDLWSFRFSFLKVPLLILRFSAKRSSSDRQLFYIVGGLLVSHRQSKNGRLEFREVLGGKFCLAAVHEFSPSLPWFVYKHSQAVLHLIVMNRFARHLKRKVAPEIS